MIKKKPPDKDKTNKYINSLTFYKTVKTSLKKVIKHQNTLQEINKIVVNVNKIVIHTYHFLKLYCLYHYDNKLDIPTIDYKLIKNTMKVICNSDNEDNRGRKPKEEIVKLKKKLKEFYDKHYKPLISEKNTLYFTKLNTLLDYEAEKIKTCYENHIKIHFYDFFNRYINVLVNKKKQEEIIKEKHKGSKEELKKELSEYRKGITRLKKDLLEHEDKCKKEYKKIKNKVRKELLKDFNKTKGVNYQVICDPLKFIHVLIKMSIDIEKKKETTFSVFPLRKNIIPKYIKLDTTTVIHNFFGNKSNKSFYLTKGNTKLYQHDIWNMFFRTEKKMFKKKGYTFSGELSTDGCSCSILLIRKDLYNSTGKNKVPKTRKPKNFRNELYIDELKNKDKKDLLKYDVVGVDPGKCDLVFCSTKINNEIKTFRYSSIQRMKETRSKKYLKIIENDKLTKIKKKTVKDLETTLSKYDSKSCIYKNVVRCIKYKNKVNYSLYKYYEKDLYRKLKWFGFINRQRSENWMINNFKDKFGDKDKIIIAFGDYEQKKHLKYKPPTKGIGMRKIFRQAGYKVFLVDEYKTSKINHFNLQENEKFRKRINPRPWKDNVVVYHGLLRSKSVPNSKSDKQIIVNRDVNGSLNIRMLGLCHLKNKKIPKVFGRQKQ